MNGIKCPFETVYLCCYGSIVYDLSSLTSQWLTPPFGLGQLSKPNLDDNAARWFELVKNDKFAPPQNNNKNKWGLFLFLDNIVQICYSLPGASDVTAPA
jgi:hypothetical protein